MTRFFISILLVLIPGFSGLSIAGAPRVYIQENDKGITIRVDDAPLSEVAKSIEGKTGIQFHISPSVPNDRMTINLNAPDWQTAIRKLLEPYGRAELWNPKLELTEIHILSRGNTARVSSDPPQPNTKITEADMRASSKLKRRQLLKLASGSLNRPLPSKLYNDPEIKEFLNQHGIQSPEDMDDARKARSIRLKARRILMERDKAKRKLKALERK